MRKNHLVMNGGRHRMINPTAPIYIPNDSELLLRLKNFEDDFVERKTTGDSKDWLKSAVAFANSAPIGFPCVLYIGFKDDGTPEDIANQPNLEKLQNSVEERLQPAYPHIIHYHRVFSIGDQQRLAVIIPGSEARPHFTKRPHLRKGHQSVEATDEECEMLLAYRNSKAAWILRWKDKVVTVQMLSRSGASLPVGRETSIGGIPRSGEYKITNCNPHFVTLYKLDSMATITHPLAPIDLKMDDNKPNQLLLLIRSPYPDNS